MLCISSIAGRSAYCSFTCPKGAQEFVPRSPKGHPLSSPLRGQFGRPLRPRFISLRRGSEASTRCSRFVSHPSLRSRQTCGLPSPCCSHSVTLIEGLSSTTQKSAGVLHRLVVVFTLWIEYLRQAAPMESLQYDAVVGNDPCPNKRHIFEPAQYPHRLHESPYLGSPAAPA